MFTTNSSIIARPDLIVGYAPILEVSALVGGDATALNGIDLRGVASGYTFGVGVTGVDGLTWWKLRERAAGEAQDGAGFVDTYSDTNRILVRVG